jgi:hypothetical protein
MEEGDGSNGRLGVAVWLLYAGSLKSSLDGVQGDESAHPSVLRRWRSRNRAVIMISSSRCRFVFIRLVPTRSRILSETVDLGNRQRGRYRSEEPYFDSSDRLFDFGTIPSLLIEPIDG